MHTKSVRWKIALTGLVILVIVTTVWYKLFREVEQAPFDSVEELFKYGSIGNEATQGVPYWIWYVLPKMFPEYLPSQGGYASLGIPWEAGKPLPVGFSKKTLGVPRVAFNCAFCHTATYRLNPDDSYPTIVPAGPSHTINAQAYPQFLLAAASDAKFNANDILAQIDLVYELSWLDRLLYRYVLIPGTKKALKKEGENFTWTEALPPWGKGRIDPFNPIKYGILQMGIDGTIGNADMVPLWNMKAREGKALHWDGLNTNLHEVVISSAIGDGMTNKSFPQTKDNLKRIEEWLITLSPPKSPFSTPDTASLYYVNPELKLAGKTIFEQQCANCHSGTRTGTVIPVEEVGTDRHRVDMWTAESAKRYNSYQNEYWNFQYFQNQDGYVAVLLDGLWLRGPYLHNGSVPTLRDLLNKPEDRPKDFYRGYDLLDPVKVGFVSQGKEAEQIGFRYDTSVLGNSNQGHLYGTDLPEAEKQALLEYLKTL